MADLPLPRAAVLTDASSLLFALLLYAFAGLLAGYAEGLQNRERHTIRAGNEAKAASLNRLWHTVLLVSRVGVTTGALWVLLLAAGLPGWTATALAAALALLWHLAHQLGHNGEQGQAYHYLGSQAASDRLLSRVGTVPVFVVFVVATIVAVATTLLLW